MNSGTITVKPVEEGHIASCNVCIARNYEPKGGGVIGRRVDKLYEVHVSSGASGLSICLCRDCLGKLVEEAQRVLGPASETGEAT